MLTMSDRLGMEARPIALPHAHPLQAMGQSAVFDHSPTDCSDCTGVDPTLSGNCSRSKIFLAPLFVYNFYPIKHTQPASSWCIFYHARHNNGAIFLHAIADRHASADTDFFRLRSSNPCIKASFDGFVFSDSHHAKPYHP
jgi:hypothetical protein